MPNVPNWLEEDPPTLSEGLSWYVKGPPPVHRVYSGGTIYETSYALAPGESSLSGAATMDTFSVEADQYLTRWANLPSWPPSSSITRRPTDSFVSARRSAENYPRGWVYVTTLTFDTAELPDTATILTATLRLYVQLAYNADQRNFRGEYYLADGTLADYTDNGASGTTAFDVPISSITSAGDMDFTLQNLSFISKTSDTGFRLHVTGAVPTGENRVDLAAYEHTTQPEARLLVTYTP